jgi:MFS family permease
VFGFIIAFGVTKALTNLVAGPLTGRHTRKRLLVAGWAAGLISAILLGIGTAMAQPALSAAVADHTHPSWRAQGLGVYRFWRDLGYAIGAVIAGLLAQVLGLSAAVIAGGVLTLASGLLAARWITGGSRHVATPGPAAALRC